MGGQFCLLYGLANNAYLFSESVIMVKSIYYLPLPVFNHNLYFHFAFSTLLARKNYKTSRALKDDIKQL